MVAGKDTTVVELGDGGELVQVFGRSSSAPATAEQVTAHCSVSSVAKAGMMLSPAGASHA